MWGSVRAVGGLLSGLHLELDDYRRFRHRVRHLYGYELEGERVLGLARGVRGMAARVREAVGVLGEWLEPSTAP